MNWRDAAGASPLDKQEPPPRSAVRYVGGPRQGPPDRGAFAELADEAVAALCLADLVVGNNGRGAAGLPCRGLYPASGYLRALRLDGNISVRRAGDDREIAAFQTGRRVRDYSGLEFSPDGRYLRATTYDEPARSRLFRIDVTPPTTIVSDNHIALAFSPDSRQFVARYRGNEYRVYELPSGKEISVSAFPASPMIPA